MDNSSYVWYATYGSNLCRDRFLCYIQGGRPNGSSKFEIGCGDKTPPKDDKPVAIPFPLYFAKCSKRWNGGVAFVGLEKAETHITLGRMYLITESQFSDIFIQENGNEHISIDFEKVKKHGSMILRNSWYGNVVYFRNQEGFPIFTFTGYWNIGDEPFVAPSANYLKTLSLGLKETYNLSKDKIVEYLIKKHGIKQNFTKEKIISLLGNFT